MIDVFKSSDGKKAIVAIYPDSEISLSETGDVKLIIGSEKGITDLRIALNSDRDGWTREEVEKAKFPANPPLSVEQKQAIIALQDKGKTFAEIVKELRLFGQGRRVSSVMKAHKYSNQQRKKQKTELTADSIIEAGRKCHMSYLLIADRINREVGGNWLPNDVAKRILEMKG